MSVNWGSVDKRRMSDSELLAFIGRKREFEKNRDRMTREDRKNVLRGLRNGFLICAGGWLLILYWVTR